MENVNVNANANASGNANAKGNAATSSGEPAVSRKAVERAMDAALGPGMEQSGEGNAAAHAPGAAQQPARNAPYPAPYHAHGSVLEGGDSPAVLAQPASASSQGQGSPLRPERLSAGRRAQRVISGAQDVAVARYRLVTEGTDDFVHDNPWKSIAMAAIGGLIVGLLIAR
ncbi:YqjD family protein [Caballeronia sp. Sq4a]|uniref:DUF883 family protein n=1 Tax=Caballeronia sp. Sq4a TaxID=2878152 RepID=UPI0020BFC278|nr:DUF883 domain-containing protein [Caballeronia sp. Sq4a]